MATPLVERRRALLRLRRRGRQRLRVEATGDGGEVEVEAGLAGGLDVLLHAGWKHRPRTCDRAGVENQREARPSSRRRIRAHARSTARRVVSHVTSEHRTY